MKGARPKPVVDNLVQLPAHESPQAANRSRAKKMMPDFLLEDEKAVWMEICPKLDLLGRLHPLYINTIAEYCVIVARVRKNKDMLDTQGWFYETASRDGSLLIKPHPLAAQYNDDWKKLRSILGEFGLAPASERVLKNIKPNAPSAFDEFR